jgi:VIT1/CCC1 family predicted Fe2+/Mn2+ transporter
VAEDPRESWFQERQSAWLYRQVAAAEADPPKRQLFESLASAAEEQASTWARLAGIEPSAGPFRPSARARLTAALVRRLGVKPLRPVLVAMKMRGLSVYDRATLDGHAMPTAVEQVGARHRGGGGNLRAAVFGVNDGLVSNASLIMGVAGAGAEPGYVLTAGIAGLLAGALSMAAGEYVSVRSQREMFEYQIGLERDELAEYPEEEAEELALIYAARGMELSRAREVALELMKNPQHALDTLAREELGLNPDDLGSPAGAAVSSFAAFAAGALVPLLPFLVTIPGAGAIPVAILLTAVSLFGVGMALSLFTGRSAAGGGLRMVAIGGGAGLITWLIGRMVGVGLG